MFNRKVLIYLFLSYYAMHCFEQMYFLMGPILEGQGISHATTGWILGIFFVGVIGCRPIGGWALEHLGVRKTLVFMGSIGFFASVLIALFYTNVPVLLFARFLTGLSYGGYVVAMLAYQTLVIPVEKRAGAVALITTGGMLPMATITVLGEWLLRRGHIAAYFWMAPIAALCCIYLGTRLDEPGKVSSGESKSWGKYRDLFRLQPFVLLLGTAVLISLLDGSVVSIASLAVKNDLVASSFFASSAITGVLSRIVMARFIDDLPRKLLLVPSLLMMAISLTWIAFFPSTTSFLFGGMGFGAGIGIGFPMMISMVSLVVGKKLQPKGTVTLVTVFDLGWVFTPLIIGYGAEFFGIEWSFRLLGVVAFVLGLVVFLYGWLPLYRRDKSRAQ